MMPPMLLPTRRERGDRPHGMFGAFSLERVVREQGNRFLSAFLERFGSLVVADAADDRGTGAHVYSKP